MPQLRSFQDQSPTSGGLSHRYRHLRTTHHSLERSLTGELRRPLPDPSVIQRLKRRKLLIKDELAAIERLFAAIGRSGNEVISPPREGYGSKAAPSTQAGQDPGNRQCFQAATARATTTTH